MPRESWDEESALESDSAGRRALREVCGMRIAWMRESRGLSQEQMGGLMRPPRRKQAISQWERGLVDASLTQLVEIARVLWCSVHSLIPEFAAQESHACKDIGKKIRKQRERKGLSQAELGEKIGLRSDALGEIEYGLRPVGVDMLLQIATGLGVKPAALIRNPPAQSQTHDCGPHLQSVG